MKMSTGKKRANITLQQKNTSQARGVFLKNVIGLAAAYSPRAQAQVPSVLAVLTSEFGKGSGVSRRGATKPMTSFDVFPDKAGNPLNRRRH
jgi:hypothetical protein